MSSCAGVNLPPKLKFTKFVHTAYGLKSIATPVCYNNPVAPHSIEGTLFSIGDAWLKEGELERAKLWYENPQTSPTYDTWKYQHMLEDRLARLEFFRDKFRADSGKLDVEEPAMSGQSGISSGICHTY